MPRPNAANLSLPKTMKHTTFKTFLTSNLMIEEKEIISILENCKVKQVKKDEFLLRKNEHCSHTFFVEKDSQVIFLDESFIQMLSNKVPHFTDFNNRLLHNHIRHLQNRINLLLSTNAKDRYLQFVKMYPDILLRVPQTMVASYLGITPESLSRVRKELAKKNFKG